MSQEKKYTIKELIGKNTFTSDGVNIGKIVNVIDQPDSEEDDDQQLGDITQDLFQIVVELNPEVFPVLQGASPEVLFSSQTINKVFNEGAELKLTKELIENHLK
ncbi:MAG: hypothetical protein GF308_12800 [Candidatus Heimdallarchaeota archaeon]|nr:hypothetical protein [Candidatus Heimdallarchaeota archaeon]